MFNSRKDVITSINHRQPDKLPIELQYLLF
jgi:hypothetical protein